MILKHVQKKPWEMNEKGKMIGLKFAFVKR
jgi:hypothetical protein